VVSLDFSVTYSFLPYHGPEVDLAPSENEYQEHFLGGKGGRCVRLKTSPHSCAECRENLGVETSWNPLGHIGPVTGHLYLYLFTSFINKCYIGSCDMTVILLDTAHGLFLVFFLISYSQYSSHDISVV
jgi:hypothetical protein